MEQKGKVREGSFMNSLRTHYTPALAALAGAALLAIAAVTGAAAQALGPTLTSPAGPEKALAADGFIPRWLLLEPIPANGLTEGIVRAAVKKEYFPNQFTVIPKDGDKVTVNDKELTWHAVETKLYNVNLFHFARALNRPTRCVTSAWLSAPTRLPSGGSTGRRSPAFSAIARRSSTMAFPNA
jgi:hypothetical protein